MSAEQSSSKAHGGSSGTFISNAKRVEGKPSAVRDVGGESPVDFWNTVVKGGMVSKHLDQLLDAIKDDQEYSMGQFILDIEYQGFNREFYIRMALGKISVSIFCRFALLGALRGSNFTKINETCESMPADLTTAHRDFVKTPKKRTDLTILRCTASIPHWVSMWMHIHGVPKKIQSNDCPSALQYPGAASLPMSKTVRKQHISFCQEFSALLPGGTFNANIYIVAYQNPIPFSAIPAAVIQVLGIGSASEAYSLTDDEKREMSRALVKKT